MVVQHHLVCWILHTTNSKQTRYTINARYDMARLREDAIRILNQYGYGGEGVEKCADEWVSKQSVNFGLVKYYEAYYNSFNTK